MSSRAKAKGIFCIESGDWWSDLRKSSTVKPILNVLQQEGCHNIPHIHRTAYTEEEFDAYIRLWSLKKFANYPILYLAMHGESKELRFQDSSISLKELGAKLAGKCRGRVIYLSACETMNCDRRELRTFLKTTEALAVCGYTVSVDWLESVAFELVFFSDIQKNVFQRNGMEAVRRRMLPFAKSFGKHLDSFEFRMEVHPGY